MSHLIPDSAFRKSSFSQPNNNNCVEVADLAEVSAVRDTQNRSAGHLEFDHEVWAGLVAAVKGDAL